MATKRKSKAPARAGNAPMPGALGGYKDGHTVSTENIARLWGIHSFLKAPLLRDVKGPTIGILGVPFDGGIIRSPGTRFGPRGVRNASFRASSYHPDYDVVPHELHRIADCGDVVLSPFSIEDAYQSIEKAVKKLLARRILPIAVGGDHSISTPILRALHAKHGPMALVQFDAHSDTSDTAFGQPHHHGSPFRRSIEEGLIDPKHMIQVGIRKYYARPADRFVRDRGIEVISADAMRAMGADLKRTLAKRFRRLKGRPIYVTFDIDFLDHAFVPGTGGPEPFGPDSREARECLMALKDVGGDIVGFDLVEVSPPLDVRDQTSVLAAQLLFEMVALLPPTVR
jgi:agmatinase